MAVSWWSTDKSRIAVTNRHYFAKQKEISVTNRDYSGSERLMMRRRLSETDFERAQTSMKSPKEFGHWWRCEEYEIKGDEILAKWPFEESVRWGGYFPLEHTPRLFLELAELSKESDFREATLRFCHKWGVPGNLIPKHYVVETTNLFGFQEWKVRQARMKRMNLSGLQEEVKKIAEIIDLYERALNGDEEVIQLPPGMPGSAGSPEMYTDHGLGWAVALVTERVQRLCRPTLYFTPEYLRPETIVSGIGNTWEFANLLGAAYLQMWWIMTSEGEIARCEYCHRRMSLARSGPHGRKRRRDKRFCSDSCRQAHHRSKTRS
jgi:hypothetical protein